MRKRWFVVIIIVGLILSFIIYQFFNSRSSGEIDMIEADIVESRMASSDSSVDRASIEISLEINVPIYFSMFRNMSHNIIASVLETYSVKEGRGVESKRTRFRREISWKGKIIYLSRTEFII